MKEAGEILGLSYSTMRYMVKAGKIPAGQLGGSGKVFIPGSFIDGFIAECQTARKKNEE